MAIQDFVTGQVLTAAQMDALQANDYNQTVSAKVASYVLAAADKGTRVTMSNAGATTITVNTSLFAAGDTLFITNIGAGATTITAGTATVSTASSLVLAQYDSGRLYFTSTGVAIWEKYAGASISSSKIGQVITATYSTQYANATTTYGDTGLTATITPTAASSKVLVIITQPISVIHNSSTSAGAFWNILRDATSLNVTGAEQSVYLTGASGNLQIGNLGFTYTYMDSPSSTSALVYKTQTKGDSAGVTVYTSIAGAAKATITLLEVLA